MEPPIPLAGHALTYWHRHAPPLAAAGTLTDRDAETFVLLCQAWAKLQTYGELVPGPERFREMVQYTNLLKMYHQYAKQFGLMPRERKAAKMDADPPRQKDEFGL